MLARSTSGPLDIWEKRKSFLSTRKRWCCWLAQISRKGGEEESKKRAPKDNYNPWSVMSWKNRREWWLWQSCCFGSEGSYFVLLWAGKLPLLSFLFMHKIDGEICCHFFHDVFSLVSGTCQRESEKYKVNQYWSLKRQRERKRPNRHVMITVLAVPMCHQLHATFKLEKVRTSLWARPVPFFFWDDIMHLKFLTIASSLQRRLF